MERDATEVKKDEKYTRRINRQSKGIFDVRNDIVIRRVVKAILTAVQTHTGLRGNECHFLRRNTP